MTRSQQIKLHPAYKLANRAFWKARRVAKNAAMQQRVGGLHASAEWRKFEILLRRRPHLSCASPHLKDDNGQVYSTAKEKCELFAAHFFPSGQDARILPLVTAGDGSTDGTIMTETGLPPVPLFELQSAIDGLERGKAAVGPDLLKRAFTLCDTFRRRFLDIVNACVCRGEFPSRWRHATITVIGKPGLRDPCLASSYRPISLLCVASKVMESIIKTRLQWEIERQGLLLHQYTAIPGVSATHALAMLLQKGRDAVADRKEVALFSIDVGGAFNQIEHSALASLLQTKNLQALARWVMAWLKHRTFSVTFEGHASTTLQMGGRGIPQGSPLSPLLWCLYLDSFFESIQLSPDADTWETGAYMDDLFMLVVADSKPAMRRRLQTWLDALGSWCEA